jgi:hypothetical protein
MVTSNAPVRVPERQPETVESSNPQSRQAGWRPEKKPTRFVIKVGSIVPC